MKQNKKWPNVLISYIEQDENYKLFYRKGTTPLHKDCMQKIMFTNNDASGKSTDNWSLMIKRKAVQVESINFPNKSTMLKTVIL